MQQSMVGGGQLSNLKAACAVSSLILLDPLWHAKCSGGAAMRGLVQDRHLFSHARIIVREFGLKAYLRCVLRALIDRRSTFLRGIH